MSAAEGRRRERRPEMAVNAETTRSRELRLGRVLLPPGRLVPPRRLVLVLMLALLGMSVLVVLLARHCERARG